MKNKPLIFIRCPDCGRRLCRDTKWREHAPLGDYAICLKFYKWEKSAFKFARQHTCSCKTTEERTRHGITSGMELIYLHEGDSVDAAGNVVRKTLRPCFTVVGVWESTGEPFLKHVFAETALAAMQQELQKGLYLMLVFPGHVNSLCDPIELAAASPT